MLSKRILCIQYVFPLKSYIVAINTKNLIKVISHKFYLISVQKIRLFLNEVSFESTVKTISNIFSIYYWRLLSSNLSAIWVVIITIYFLISYDLSNNYITVYYIINELIYINFIQRYTWVEFEFNIIFETHLQ